MLNKYLKEKKETVEQNLQKKLEKYRFPENLSEAMNYAVMNGGKRLRPILMYMICDVLNEGVDKKYEKMEDLATALEFIHCYSLVHDDLPAMDNDDYRRGKLTVHKKYDEATAILVGDALLTEAFRIITDSEKISDSKKVQIIGKLSEYAGFYGMIGGQFVDIQCEKKGSEISYSTLKFIHAHKTGKLITASIELPLIALGIEGEKREKLIEYSELIGLAFQIKDDILDIEGTFEKLGKKSNDIENGKTTYPSLFGLEKSKEMLNDCLEKAAGIVKSSFGENELLTGLTEFIGNREK